MRIVGQLLREVLVLGRAAVAKREDGHRLLVTARGAERARSGHLPLGGGGALDVDSNAGGGRRRQRGERLRERGGGGEAVVRGERQRAGDDRRQGRGDVGPRRARIRRGRAAARGDEGVGRRVGPGRLAGEQLEQEGAERVQIGPRVHPGEPRDLLGRHVPGRAVGAVADVRLGEGAGDAEVGQDDAPAALQEDVAGLEIEVHHARRVRRAERVADGARQLDRLGDAVLAGLAREPAGGQHLREGGALDELHGEELLAVRLPDVEDAGDVAVRDAARELDLAAEALDHRALVGEIATQHLQRDDVVQLGVERAVDVAHPSGAEEAEDAVPPQLLPGGRRGEAVGRRRDRPRVARVAVRARRR